MADPPPFSIVSHQRELFAILEEFFVRATGVGVEAVGGLDRFPEWVRANSSTLAPLGPGAYQWADQALSAHYEATRREDLYQRIRALPGVKLVFGGGSRFTAAHYAAARRVMLYCDTLLIPDPVLPWLEAPRPWEKFPIVQRLQAAFTLLHLKPLVDANLPYPALVVFPSWEKSLERQDQVTRESQEALVVGVVASAVGIDVATRAEIAAFAKGRPEDFLSTIEREHLFVAPGLDVGVPLTEALASYRAFLTEWRTDDFVEGASRLSDAELALLGVVERIQPQYHLLENAESLVAHPLLALPAQSHYFKLTARYMGQRAERLGLLNRRTVAEIEAINFSEFSWLGDVPIDALVKLRAAGENEHFRSTLSQFTQSLHDASLDELDLVAGQVARGIESLLREHQRALQDLDKKYNRLDLQTLLLAGTTAAVPLIPALAPLVGGAALLAPLGKLAWDRAAETLDRRAVAGSLMGVLAHARSKPAT